MKKILPLISAPFFLPLFFLFMSAFDCTPNKTNLYSDELKCYSEIYYINVFLSIISITCLVPISILTQTIFYEYSLEGDNRVLSKTTSKPEVFFLFEKICLTVIFVMLDGNENIHIILICSLIIFSVGGVFQNFYYVRFNANILNQIHKFFSLTLFWASFVLFIGKILKSSRFDGCLGLFFLSVPIFGLLIFFEKNEAKENILTYLDKNLTHSQMLKTIKSISELIDKIENDREAKILLEGYISLFENNCPLKDCALKRYKKSINEGFNGKIYLLQHVDNLYEICLSKFPGVIEVKFAYALFLMKKLNKRQQAIDLLKGIEEVDLSIEEEFIIYICNKYFDNHLSLFQSDDITNNEIMNELEYQQLVNQFENLINEATFIYLQFWSELLVSHSKGIENLYKMNEITGNIYKIIEQINETFQKMQKLKNKDFPIIKLYCDFINNILNDKEKGQKFENLLEEIEQTNETPLDVEFNFDKMNNNDSFRYIILSTKKSEFGLINNISLSLLEIFGYTKKEIIGKPLNLIMPEIFITEHDKLLKNKLNSFKKTISNQSISIKSEPKELLTYAQNKSKYLIHLTFKTLIFHNENNETFFVASVKKPSYKKPKEQNLLNKIVLLTNTQLHIQNFTANAISLLKLNSIMIKNNFEITYFIKQLYDDYLNSAMEISEINYEKKLELKRNIIEKKYNTPQLINWRKLINFDSKYVSSKILDFAKIESEFPITPIHGLTPKNYNNNLNNNINNNIIDNFYLTVEPVKINKKTIGYYFQFEKTNNSKSSKILPNITPKTLSLNYDTTFLTEQKIEMNLNKIQTVNVHNETNDINYNFIPENNYSFDLDLDNLAFKRIKNCDDSLNLILKERIMKVLKEDENKKKKNENEEEEEEEFEEDEEEENEVSNSFDEIKETPKIKSLNSFRNDLFRQEKPNNENDNYYKVNLSNLHFLMYNFSRNVCSEVKDWEKISQVDSVINIQKKSVEKDQKKDIIKKQTQKNDYFTPINKVNTINKEQDIKSFFEEIEYSLSKEESQKSIRNLARLSFLIYSFLIVISIITLLYINSFLKEIKENSILINNSYLLIVLNSYGIYYCRELILLNNENYTELPTRNSRDIYISSIYNNILDVFHQSQTYIAEIVSSTLKLSKDNKYLVSNKTYEIIMIKNNYTIFSVNSTMQGLFIETNTQLFNIATKFLYEIIPTQHDVFSFMYNALNNAGNAYDYQGEIYINELNRKVKEIKIVLIIGYVFIGIILIGIFFLVIFYYDKVNKRKESYIQVFFHINIDIIQKSLDKCEIFNQKMKNMKEGIEEDNESIDSNSKSETPHKKKKQIESNNSNEQKSNTLFSYIKLFNIKVQIFLLLVYVFFTIIFGLLIQLLQQAKINELYFQHEVLVENEFYLVFNILREFLFDKSSIVSYQLSSDFLDYELQNIFTVRKKGTGVMNRNRKKVPGLYIKYSSIKKKIPCYFRRDDYFQNEKECLVFMDNSTKFGFNVMNGYYLEEIRFMKSLAYSYYKGKSGYFNLTFTGTPEGEEMWPTDENILSNFFNPIDLFNHRIVRDLNVMLTNLIFPYFVQLKDATISCINDYLNNFNDNYYYMCICFICVISFLFFVLWIPFIKRLSTVIYKTKKMLMIIPKDILMNISCIYSLLDINPIQNIENEIK